MEVKTTFDSLKKIEDSRKKRIMAHLLNEIKALAKEVLTNKKLVELYLNELTGDKKEQKQIIDWINSLPDTKLSEDDLREIKKEVEEEVAGEKKKVDKKIEESPFVYSNFTSDSLCFNATATNSIPVSTLTLANTSYCSTSDGIVVA